MIAGLDHDGAAGWWSPLPQPQVLEDSLAHGRVLDDRDQPHLAAAPSADQNVLPPHAPEQLGPRETASAPRVVRADEVGVGRVVVLVLLLVLLRTAARTAADQQRLWVLSLEKLVEFKQQSTREKDQISLRLYQETLNRKKK